MRLEYHGDTEIVTRTVEGPIHRHTYADALRALEAIGERDAEARHRHERSGGDDRLEYLSPFRAHYGISGIGAVMHTLNPRLFPDQLRYMVNHAEDKIMFLDLTFVPLAEKMATLWPTISTTLS